MKKISTSFEIQITLVMIALTLFASVLFSVTEIPVFLHALFALNYVLAAEYLLFIAIVSFLIYGNFIYQFTRLGYFKRLQTFKPATANELDHFQRRKDLPYVTILIPSYKEDKHVIMQTVLSAALQIYPRRRVVLLIDDPRPKNDDDRHVLSNARSVMTEVRNLLSKPHEKMIQEREAFHLRQRKGEFEYTKEKRHLAALYKDVAGWFLRQAKSYHIHSHTDELFVQSVFMKRATFSMQKSDYLKKYAKRLSEEHIEEAYNHLEQIFTVSLDSFERKGYYNLSHEPNKAMNLNTYISLLGKHFREEQKEKGTYLVETDATNATMTIPDSDYVLTLDADSMLLSAYTLRLVHVMEKSENAKIAVAQTPYSAIPKAPGILERIAGATTDIQYIIHQGFTYFGATFWVGANALIRKSALHDIQVQSKERGFTFTKYIQDRTVIEDTESTVDLIHKGWKLYNYPARLAYSATPSDFGSLLIQRQRWANGGLIILPKLLMYLLYRPSIRKIAEGFMRFHYLSSIAGVSVGTVILLTFPFDTQMQNIWLPLTAVPYYFLYIRDLVLMRYKKRDLLRIYAFNLMLIPINLGGVMISLYQGLLKKKIPFGRTPKVKGRTSAPTRYILAEFLLLGYCIFAFTMDAHEGKYMHALFTLINGVLFMYVFTWFMGWRASAKDIFRHYEY